MERQVKELKIDAWKMYTGAELAKRRGSWTTRKWPIPAGRSRRSSHQNLSFTRTAARRVQREGMHAARLERREGLADLNFLFTLRVPWLRRSRAGTGDKIVDKKTDDPQEMPWISDILRILKRTSIRTSTLKLVNV